MLKQNQMLKNITKLFSNEKGNEKMKQDEQMQAPVLAVNEEMATQLEQAQASLAAQSADFAAMQELMVEMSAKLETATALLATAEEAKAALITDAAAKRLAARQEAIVAAVGTDKADALMAATTTLDDAQFNAVVSAMAASFEAEAKTEMFTEAGVAAEVKQEVTEQDTVKKLAAAIEAEFNQTK